LDSAALTRRPAAKRSVQAELAAIRLDIAWSEWLIGEQAKIQAIRIPYLERSRQLTARMKDLADDELARALVAVTRGDLPAASLDIRRLSATDASARDRDSENALAQARLDLNRTLGLDPGQAIDIAASATTTMSALDRDEIYRLSVERRADLLGLRALYEGSAATRMLAGLGRYPLPVVAVNWGRDTGAIRTIGPGVSLTLPVWNRARGDLAIADASRAQLRAEYAARLETIRADIASAHTALGIVSKQAKALADEIRPLATQAEAMNRAVTRGDLSQSAGVAALMALLDKQLVGNGLTMAAAELAIALEIAAGYPLVHQL
ncbi:MAG: TolC family protein, partial [Halioglobus sp.]|nr:TolC family protein [Halioglobus sp.]